MTNTLLSAGEIQYLAKVGVHLEYLVRWDDNVTAVELAAFLSNALQANTTVAGSNVLDLVAQSTDNNVSDRQGALTLLSDFQHMPTDRIHGTAVLFILMTVISGSLVVLRLYSRHTHSGGLQRDDWWVIVAWIFAAITAAEDSVRALRFNWEAHVWNQTFHQIRVHFMIAYADDLEYFVSTACFKTALLILYHDMCDRRYFRYATSTMMVLIWIYFALGVAYFFGTCHPLDKWDHPYSIQCIPDALRLGLAITCADIALDAIILLLPLTVVWGLNLRFREKVVGLLLLSIGGLTTIASIMMLTLWKPFLESNDLSWRSLKISRWSLLEPHLGIICACIPALRKSILRTFPKIRKRLPSILSKPVSTTNSQEPVLRSGHQSTGKKQSAMYGIDTQISISEMESGLGTFHSGLR